MKPEQLLDNKVLLHCGDMLKVLPTLKANSIDSVVCDPPYHLVSIVKRFGNATADDVRRNAEDRKTSGQGVSPYAHLARGYAAKSHMAMKGGAPPYRRHSRGFMGKHWDGGNIAQRPETWAEIYRVLKPGGHVLAFGGTRTFGRMQLAMELAGFEIRDTVMWLYGSGFPKSHDISKHLDAKLKHGKTSTRQLRKVNETRPGAGRKGGRLPNAGIMSGNMRDAAVSRDQPITEEAAQWAGWGTALKPAVEPILLARKPLDGTVAENVLKWGTGGINIDGCRIGDRVAAKTESTGAVISDNVAMSGGNYGRVKTGETTNGRFPANVIHDGSDEVVRAFPESQDGVAVGGKGNAASIYGNKLDKHPAPDQTYRLVKASKSRGNSLSGSVDGSLRNEYYGVTGYGDYGSAARFFYTAKADPDDRIGSKHPTVKPMDLMRYLVRLVTPPGGTVLDPFAGTGTTGEAAWREGCRAVLVEMEKDYQNDIRVRMKTAKDYYARENAKYRNKPLDMGPFFT